MAIKFRCPKCYKVFSVKKEYAGKNAKCSCGAIIVVPRHKMSKAEICIVDEVHSQLPFFIVYRIARTSTLESSIKRAMASESEVILAKLFVISKIRRRKEQLTFTNRRIIILRVQARLWFFVWHVLGGIVGSVPVMGFFLEACLGMFRGLLSRLFKRVYRQTERLGEVGDEVILSMDERRKRVAKGILGFSVPYTKIVQPSLGVSIRHHWFAFHLSKIRGTTLRFIPVGRLRSALNGFWDGADYLLPDSCIVDRLKPVLRALQPHLPFGETELTETNRAVSLTWPAHVGVGARRWSVRGTNALTIALAAITLFFLFFTVFMASEETEAWFGFLWAMLSGIGTLLSLQARRFSEAMLIALITIFFLVGWMVIVIK